MKLRWDGAKNTEDIIFGQNKTPRTDAASYPNVAMTSEGFAHDGHEAVSADFAKTLETELIEERNRSASLEGDRIELQAKIGHLEQQLAAVSGERVREAIREQVKSAMALLDFYEGTDEPIRDGGRPKVSIASVDFATILREFRAALPLAAQPGERVRGREGVSDTPRTDAAAIDGWSGDALAVPVEFAQQLEREIEFTSPELEDIIAVLQSGNAARAAVLIQKLANDKDAVERKLAALEGGLNE